MIGALFKWIGIALTLILVGPPAVGAAAGFFGSAPMPVFAPKDWLGKSAYGMLWGTYGFWDFVRGSPSTGAKFAAAGIQDGTIGKIEDHPEYANNSQVWDGIFAQVINGVPNATDYYITYANSFGVDKSQAFTVSVYIVSQDGAVQISELSAVWDTSTMALGLGDPQTPAGVRYGVVVSLDTAALIEFLVTGQNIDYGKIALYAVSTFYNGNVCMWEWAAPA